MSFLGINIFLHLSIIIIIDFQISQFSGAINFQILCLQYSTTNCYWNFVSPYRIASFLIPSCYIFIRYFTCPYSIIVGRNNYKRPINWYKRATRRSNPRDGLEFCEILLTLYHCLAQTCSYIGVVKSKKKITYLLDWMGRVLRHAWGGRAHLFTWISIERV